MILLVSGSFSGITVWQVANNVKNSTINVRCCSTPRSSSIRVSLKENPGCMAIMRTENGFCAYAYAYFSVGKLLSTWHSYDLALSFSFSDSNFSYTWAIGHAIYATLEEFHYIPIIKLFAGHCGNSAQTVWGFLFCQKIYIAPDPTPHLGWKCVLSLEYHYLGSTFPYQIL